MTVNPSIYSQRARRIRRVAIFITLGNWCVTSYHSMFSRDEPYSHLFSAAPRERLFGFTMWVWLSLTILPYVLSARAWDLFDVFARPPRWEERSGPFARSRRIRVYDRSVWMCFSHWANEVRLSNIHARGARALLERIRTQAREKGMYIHTSLSRCIHLTVKQRPGLAHTYMHRHRGFWLGM